jgi:hypothetical protein
VFSSFSFISASSFSTLDSPAAGFSASSFLGVSLAESDFSTIDAKLLILSVRASTFTLRLLTSSLDSLGALASLFISSASSDSTTS